MSSKLRPIAQYAGMHSLCLLVRNEDDQEIRYFDTTAVPRKGSRAVEKQAGTAYRLCLIQPFSQSINRTENWRKGSLLMPQRPDDFDEHEQ